MGSTIIGFDVAQHHGGFIARYPAEAVSPASFGMPPWSMHGGGTVTASYPDLIPLLLLAAAVPVLFLRGRRRSTLPHRIALAIGAGIWISVTGGAVWLVSQATAAQLPAPPVATSP